MCEHGIRELPERLCVETRLISRAAAKIQNLKYVDLGITPHINVETSIAAAVIPTLPPLSKMKALVNEATMTDNPNPVRDRGIQTEMETNTIAIQCNIDEDIAEWEFNEYFNVPENVEQPENMDADKERFLQLVQNNTKFYSNGKLECLLCGEIKANAKLMESHMSLHYGPRKLCFRCGLCFEHKILWKEHNCAPKRRNKIQRIKCPHYRCAAILISPLELYDHLNEHCGNLGHICQFCKRSFTTVGELINHQKLHKRCSARKRVSPKNIYKLPAEDTKYRKRVHAIYRRTGKRVIIKTFLSQLALKRNWSHQCNICLRRCSSFSQYQIHMKRCYEVYNRRLKQKRLSASLKHYIANGVIS